MKAVILAGGKGTRMLPLTENRPKPLIHIAGKPFLYHLINNIKSAGIKEIGIVVSYKKEKVEEFLKEFDIKAELIEQKEQVGTGDALKYAENFTEKENFIVLMADNLYSKKDIKSIMIDDNLNYVAGMTHEHPENYGVLVEKNGFLDRIVEKPKTFISNLINTALYKFTPEVFQALSKISKSERGEFEVTDAITILSEKKKVKVISISDYWFDFGYPWDALKINQFLLENMEEYRKGKVEPYTILKGKVIIEETAEIKSGSYIEGPVYIGKNVKIGPNCYIRAGTSLSDNTKVGAASEVKNSIIMPGTKVPHHNYIGDSVIGENCNFGSGTKIANLRHDYKNIFVMINGKKKDSNLHKLGCITGDNIKTGVNSSIMPGIKLSSGTLVYPNAVVFKDTEKNEIIK